MIKISNLVKKYSSNILFDKLNLEIPNNKIVGLIGQNGSGKTTLLEICMGIRRFDSGSVKINSFDLSKYISIEYRRKMGVVFQNSSMYNRLKVKEILDLFASYYDGVEYSDINSLVKSFELEEYLNTLYGKLSGGWKQRVLLAVALINKPTVLFLDEPTTGLDPKARKILWNNIKEYKKTNDCTIFLSSHYMDEVEEYCDFIVVLNKGKVVDADYTKLVLNKYDMKSLNDYYLSIN